MNEEHLDKENLELAKEHVKIAEDIVIEESKKCDGESNCKPEEVKELKEAAFNLEKTESEIEEVEEVEKSDE